MYTRSITKQTNSPEEIIHNEYDKYGNRILMIKQDVVRAFPDTLVWSFTRQYNEQGLVIKEMDRGDCSRYLYEFTEQGLISEIKKERGFSCHMGDYLNSYDGFYHWWFKNKYDKKNNIIERLVLNDDGKQMQKWIFNYSENNQLLSVYSEIEDPWLNYIDLRNGLEYEYNLTVEIPGAFTKYLYEYY